MIPLQEQALQKQVRAGEERGFSCLYQRHGRDVLGILLRLTHGDRSEAEDLVQETFLAAYQGRMQFSGKVPLRARLVGIAVRRWRDGQRRPRPKTLSGEVETVAPGQPEQTVSAGQGAARGVCRVEGAAACQRVCHVPERPAGAHGTWGGTPDRDTGRTECGAGLSDSLAPLRSTIALCGVERRLALCRTDPRADLGPGVRWVYRHAPSHKGGTSHRHDPRAHGSRPAGVE